LGNGDLFLPLGRGSGSVVAGCEVDEFCTRFGNFCTNQGKNVCSNVSAIKKTQQDNIVTLKISRTYNSKELFLFSEIGYSAV